MRTDLKAAVTSGIVLFTASFAAAQANEPERVRDTVEAQSATKLIVDWEFSAGRVNITPGDFDEVAIVDIYYTPRYVKYLVDYETKGGTGYLTLESEHRRNIRNNDSENEWDVDLSNRYPMELRMDMGACEAYMDLGGIPLTSLDMNFGAMSGEVDFSKVNTQALDEFLIECGASSVDLKSVGNANFRHLIFKSGASSVNLDLRGSYSRSAEVDIDVGVGSADIILPEGMAVRIEADEDALFSSIDFDRGNLERMNSDTYESPDFETAKTRLTIRLDVGMGSVDIRWK